jgi:twitching motility protein PilT
MNARQMLEVMIKEGASDLHLVKRVPPALRIDGNLVSLGREALDDTQLKSVLEELVPDPGRRKRFAEERELDFAFELEERARFRVNAYFQRGSMGFSIRLIPFRIPRLEELNLPDVLRELTRKQNGLVLVTGPTGSGKSTTLASMIDLINEEQSLHIVTVEDPVEYVYQAKKSIISQREVGEDTNSFDDALRHVLRQDPDVILVGEARDLETMQAVLTAAETGHLVFATLHTNSASQTIDRVIDLFPPYQQSQVRSQLSLTLQAVVSQRLLQRRDMKGRIPTTEVLIATLGVRNLVREAKTQQLYSAIELGKEHGMHTMEEDLNRLLKRKIISREDAYGVASMVEYIDKQ